MFFIVCFFVCLFVFRTATGPGPRRPRRTYLDQFLGGGVGPLINSPFRGHSEAVAYLMSKAGADANVAALMYLRRPGTKHECYEPRLASPFF